MAKKTQDPAASTKKEAKVKTPKPTKPKVPADPVKTNNLIRLLNILALLLAIIAFLLQLFAVLSYHWKWQKIDLGSVLSHHQQHEPSVHEDGTLYQNFGLFSRQVKVYANNDEHLEVTGSTKFPRDDGGDEHLHHCLSQPATLRGAFLACSRYVASSEQCHCRRHPYWNAVIVFEILALIFLGIVVFLAALLTTHFQHLLKLVAAVLSLLAFIFLLVGLILILSYLKRETRSFADAYPHIHQRLAQKIHAYHETRRSANYNPTILHQAVRRQAKEYYRLYQLLPGQYAHNETHFREFSHEANEWVYKPLSSLEHVVPIAPLSLEGHNTPENTNVAETVSSDEVPTTTTPAPSYNAYGPLIGYNQIFEHSIAGIGCSTILSIIAMVLALLIPLLLIYSWLQNKSLSADTNKGPITSVTTEYVPVPQEVPLEPLPPKAIPTDFDPQRPIGEAVVAVQNAGPYEGYVAPTEPVIVRDVIIRDEQPVQPLVQEHTYPVTVETAPRT